MSADEPLAPSPPDGDGPPGDNWVARRREARARGREKGDLYKSYMKHSIAGLEVAVAFAVGAVGGMYVDRHYQTAPWGVLVGVLLAVVHTIRMLTTLVRKTILLAEAEEAEEAAEAAREAAAAASEQPVAVPSSSE